MHDKKIVPRIGSAGAYGASVSACWSFHITGALHWLVSHFLVRVDVYIRNLANMIMQLLSLQATHPAAPVYCNIGRDHIIAKLDMSRLGHFARDLLCSVALDPEEQTLGADTPEIKKCTTQAVRTQPRRISEVTRNTDSQNMKLRGLSKYQR